MTPAGFEPTIPASERPQTHALDLVFYFPFKMVPKLEPLYRSRYSDKTKGWAVQGSNPEWGKVFCEPG